MTKINHIIGQGPELAESQKRVLEVMQKHCDHLFRMHNDDLQSLQAWMTKPNAPEPPTMYRVHHSLGTIRWAISTLYHRGKIGKIELDRRTYYGGHEAIQKARRLLESRGQARS